MTEQTTRAVVHIYEDKVDVLIIDDRTREIVNFFGIQDPEVIKSEEKFKKALEEIISISGAEEVQVIDKRQKS